MKLITRDTDYAIRALIFFAKRKTENAVSTVELSDNLKIPRPFLRKILGRLGSAEILSSQKGFSGGFILNRNPDDISLADVMKIFQGEPHLNECIFRKKLCSNRSTCPLRKKILSIEKHVLSEIKNISVGKLVDGK